MKLLLHICCGPCAVYPFRKLLRSNIEVRGFFYNPNIYPEEEYARRMKATESVARNLGIDIEIHKYDNDDYMRMVGAMKEKAERCRMCWRMRLEETARFTKAIGFTAFTTTLLISPYQDHDEIKRIASEVAASEAVKFHYCDFREGFRSSQQAAKELGLYRQKYCGCKSSLEEKATAR